MVTSIGNNPRGRRRLRRAFSVVELLVAVIIIVVLATMAIPIIQNRVDQARLTRAQHEMDALADALNRVEADTGYYVRLFMLNDLIRGDGDQQEVRLAGEIFAPPELEDGVTDYLNNGTHYHRPINRLFIYADNDNPTLVGQMVEPVLGDQLRLRLVTDADGFNWNGPYMNWQTDANIYPHIFPNNLAAGDGIPDDPWGNNYMIVTTWGLIPDGDEGWSPTTEGPVVSHDLPFGSGNTVNNLDEVVDRVSIVSLGPNGVAGNGGGTRLGTGDDLVRSIGK